MGIKVLILEDHPVFSEGLVLALSTEPEIEIVARAPRVAEAERLAAETRPDVALVDFHLPDGVGSDAARRLRAVVPGIAVVVLSGDERDEALREAISAGAVGYLSKNEPAHAIVEAVKRAAAGEALIDPEQLRRVMQPAPAAGLPELTPREREILELIGEGLDNGEIAEKLVVSVHTVRHHVGNLFDKFDAHSKLELAAKAHRAGLLRGS